MLGKAAVENWGGLVAVTLVLAGIAGLVIGSFLNVVIHRVPRGESVIRPGSRCPACATPVRAVHNIPVAGWLLLRGRCASCRGPISLRYPLVEAGTCAVFLLVAARLGPAWDLPAYLYLAGVAIALAVIDVDHHRLPDQIVLPSYPVAATLLTMASLGQHQWWPLARAGASMLIVLAGFQLLTLLYPGGIGFGDVKLAGLLGLYLGWLGWPAVLVGIFSAFLLGGTVGMGLILVRRATRRTAVAFGPYLLAGAMVALLFTSQLTQWYVDLLFVPTGSLS